MEDCRIKIYNASSDDVISARLLPFGYDEAKHTANKTIYTDTVALVKKNENEDAEWRTASELFNNQQKKTRKDFSQIRKKLKFYYPATSAEANTLGTLRRQNHQIHRFPAGSQKLLWEPGGHAGSAR